MSESPPEPPRVRVRLPGDAPARLVRWRQDTTGAWWAELQVYAPATAVRQLDGEDYDPVPRLPATPPEATATEYVLVTPNTTEKTTSELHRADCWSIPAEPTTTLRVTPVPDAKTARSALKFPDTTQCTACRPFPDLP